MIKDSEILLRTHSNGYIKSSKYYFYKSRCGECPLEVRLFLDRWTKYHIKWVIIQNQIVILETKIKVELDLSNYATKSDVENGLSLDTSKFVKKADLTR